MRKNKYQLRREATYQQLIETGMALFLDKGYALTAVDEIVRQAGFSKGAFYFHFKSKEDFFMQITAYRTRARGNWTDTPRRYSPADTSLAEVLRTAFLELNEKTQGTQGWMMVLTDFYQQTKHNTEIRDQFEAYYSQWIDEISLLVNALKSQGYVSAEKDARLAAEQIYMLSDGFLVHHAIYRAKNMDAMILAFMAILK